MPSSPAPQRSTVDDAFAIVEDEYAFVHWRMSPAEFDASRDHLEWALPAAARSVRAWSPACRRRSSSPPIDVLLVVSAGLAPRAAGASLVNEFVETLLQLTWHEPKPSYDVVIVGGGGHGLATAYYLATATASPTSRSSRPTTSARQLGPQHHDHPRQLRHPRVDPLLPAQRRALPRLEDETGCWIMHDTRGSSGWPTPRRACAASARGAVEQGVRRRDDADRPGGGQAALPADRPLRRRPLPGAGASYHLPGSTARHDRVVWAYAQGAMRRGVHVLQNTPVIGLLRDGDRVIGVQTSPATSPPASVMSAVGGNVSTIAAHAGVRLPIRTHPLQAFVTNGYAQGARPHRVSTGAALLRLADRARADADRARVRTRVELLAAVVVPVPAVVLAEDGATSCRSSAT